MTINNGDIRPQIVLDTSTVSILFNPTDFRYSYYGEIIQGCNLLISFQTVEERWYGALYAGWGRRRIAAMERQLNKFRVVLPDQAIMEKCAQLRSDTRKSGRELEIADAWIAATAITLGCPLVSDDRDFGDIANLNLIQRPR